MQVGDKAVTSPAAMAADSLGPPLAPEGAGSSVTTSRAKFPHEIDVTSFHAITLADWLPLGPYRLEHAAAIGHGKTAGYRSEITIQWTVDTYAQITIGHGLLIAGRTEWFATTTIFVKDIMKISGPVLTESNQVTAIFRHTRLMESNSAVLEPALHLSLHVRKTGIRHQTNEWVTGKLVNLAEPHIVETRDALAKHFGFNGTDAMRCDTDGVRFDFFVSCQLRFMFDVWERLRSLWQENQAGPMASIFCNCGPNRPRTLNKRTSPGSDDVDFTKHKPAISLFQTAEHRSGALGLGVLREHEFECYMSARLRDATIPALFLPDPYSLHRGEIGGYYVILLNTDVAEMLPGYGEHLLMEVLSPRALATRDLTESEIQDLIFEHVMTAIRYEEKISHIDSNTRWEIVTKRILRVCRYPPKQQPFAEAFVRASASILRRKVKHSVDGKDLYMELAQSHVARVRAWVTEQYGRGRFKEPVPTSTDEPGDSWKCRRLECPPQMVGHGGMVFYAFKPRCPFSNLGEFIKYPELKTVPAKATLAEAIRDALREKDAHIEKVVLTRHVIDITTVTMLKAIQRSTVFSDPNLPPGFSAMSRWLLNFSGSPDRHDLTRVFSLIRDLLAVVDGTTPLEGLPGDVRKAHKIYKALDPDQKRAVHQLRELDFGFHLLMGFPGSGKTSTTIFILALATSRNIPSDTQVCVTVGGRAGSPVGSNDLSAKFNRDLKISSPARIFPGHSSTQYRRPRAVFIGAVNKQVDKLCEQYVRFVRTAFGREPKIVRLNTFSREVQAFFGDNDAVSSTHHRDPENGNYSTGYVKDMADVAAAVEKSGRLAPQHHGGQFSVAALARKMMEENPREFGEILYLDALRERSPGEYDKRRKELENTVRRILCQVIDAAEVIFATPVAFANLQSRHPLPCDIIAIDEAARTVEPLVLSPLSLCTTAVFRMMNGDTRQCRPQVDSANAHRHPNISFHNCFGPQLQKSLMGRFEDAQQKISYLTINWRTNGGLEQLASKEVYDGRMVSGRPAGDITPEIARIRDFHRTKAGSAIGSRLFVDLFGTSIQMDEGVSKINEAHAIYIREHVRDMFAAGLCEKNPTQTTDGRRVRIMIVVNYTSQANLIRAHLNSLSLCEWVPELVEVMTHAVAMGDERPYVIVDFVRSEGLGITAESDIFAVTMTRAQLGEAVVLNSHSFQEGTSTNDTGRTKHHENLYANGLERQAVVKGTAQEWLAPCPQCYRPHVQLESCRLDCVYCPGVKPHHPRKCTEAAKHPMRATIPKGTILPVLAPARK